MGIFVADLSFTNDDSGMFFVDIPLTLRPELYNMQIINEDEATSFMLYIH